MKPQKTQYSHRHGPPWKTTQKDRKMEAGMGSKRAPKMISLGRPQMPKTLCFPYVSAKIGIWQGLQKGDRKGARNEQQIGITYGSPKGRS